MRISTSRSQCHQRFWPRRFSTERRHVSQYSSKKRSAPSVGSHSRWCMSNCAHSLARSCGRISSKYAVPGSGVRIVKPTCHRRSCATNAHSRSNSCSPHAGSITKLPVTPRPTLAGDANALAHPLDGRVLAQPGQAVVGRRFEAEEHVELAREGPPRLEQPGLPRHRVDAALHEHPLLAQAAPDQLRRQRLAARAVVPEQIVGDEDVIADGRRVAADGLDAALAELAVVHLPDGTERAPERTAARRLDEERRPVREAGVLAAPALDMAAGRDGHDVERDARPGIAVRTKPSGVRTTSPGTSVRARRRSMAATARRHGALAIVEHDHVDRRVGEGLRERGGRMSAQHQGGLGRETAHLLDQRARVIGLERVHAGDADDLRPARRRCSARPSG